MTLAEFLLARIGEDETIATRAEGWFQSSDWMSGAAADYGETWQPSRVLTECAAKRQIVADVADIRVLLLLALPYAAHEQFQNEWLQAK